MSQDLKGLMFGLLGVFIFGLTLPATRTAVAELDAITVSMGRAVIAAMLAGLYLFFTKARRPDSSEFKKLVATAACVIFGFPLLSSMAMQSVPASHGGVMLGILPLATVAASAVFAGERPSLAFWACSAVGAGAVVLFAILQGGFQLQIADVLLVGSVLSAAIGYAIGGQLSKNMGGSNVISWALVISLPVLIPPVLYMWPDLPATMSRNVWISFLYVAIFSQFLGFFAWNRGMVLSGIARVGQLQLLQPFITLAAAFVLLGEPLTWMTFGFASFVVVIVAVGRKLQVRQTRTNLNVDGVDSVVDAAVQED
jgi:drug/metabolite transporter (DMT)-like permease